MGTVGLVGYIKAAMQAECTLRARPSGDSGAIYRSLMLTHVPCIESLEFGT